MNTWQDNVTNYLMRISRSGLSPSVHGREITLYGTCYGLLGRAYLGQAATNEELENIESLISSCQNKGDGLVVGPELVNFECASGAQHTYEHLLDHLLCSAVLPLTQHFQLGLGSLNDHYKWCDLEFLSDWTKRIDWKNAWFEGNNILFVGQLLVYLRDVEKHPGAQAALDFWFEWLDAEVDPATSLWGTNGYCSPAEAVYGGYHQLLVYWHENRPIVNPEGLVDTVLSLQHLDGGFDLNGNAGACEDIDSVDILVHCYKRWDYRRAEIRVAVWRCVDHILSTQNPDGGFPYKRNTPQSHMGIPGTEAQPNESCTFPTWFRTHTLALAAEIIPEHPELEGINFRFNKHLSMGWHRSPEAWVLEVSESQKKEERQLRERYTRQLRVHQIVEPFRKNYHRVRRLAGRVKRKILSST